MYWTFLQVVVTFRADVVELPSIGEPPETASFRWVGRAPSQGLVPEYECYDVCSNAWGNYITGSSRKLITAGKG